MVRIGAATIVAGTIRHVGLHPDDRLESRLFQGVIKLHRAKHVAEVRDRARAESAFLQCIGEGRDANRAIEQGVLCMKMKVYEGAGHGSSSWSKSAILA